MIKNLHIRNFAIIDEIDIEFENGLTIITGETGAGKSILMGALSLVLGDRADSKMISNAAEKCVVEAVFDITNNISAKTYLEDNDFDHNGDLIIRREIIQSGKSRIFVNDTPTTLSVLTPLTHCLIDLHRQFDTIELQQSAQQLNLLDDIVGSGPQCRIFSEAFQHWKKFEKAHEMLVQQNESIKKELDYHTFVVSEIESLQLQENEIEQMESELRLLENAEAFKQSMQVAGELLQNSESPILGNIKQVMQQLQMHSQINPSMNALLERLNATLQELKDIHAEIESDYEKVYYDAEKIAVLYDRLNEANRLLKKHRLTSTDELLQLKDHITQKIIQAETADEEEQKLFLKTKELQQNATQLAVQLSDKRRKKIAAIEDHIKSLLLKVGMPNARFKIEQLPSDISKTGIDKIEFLFDANKTNHFKPLAKVASGGELSRLMLCIKSMIAGSTNLPTLIFDEIDSGISGETAIQVGHIMKQLATKHQLISITHLPQIASKAQQHLYIYKHENAEGHIKTSIKKLMDEERVNTLAEMLAGKDSSPQAKKMVKEMMK
ncbi:MAG: DNA repair protein RecN [Bacteroidetes bacterium]|nr:DNA repair protein RecN [Bacteroidota bacterium]